MKVLTITNMSIKLILYRGGGRERESDKLTLNLEKNELTVPVASLSIVTKFTKTVILDDKISKKIFIVIIDHVTHFCATLIKN